MEIFTVDDIELPENIGVNGYIGRSYGEFRRLFLDGRSITGFLERAPSKDGELLQLDGIRSPRLRTIGENLADSYKNLLDAKGSNLVGSRGLDLAIDMAGAFIPEIERRCLAYASYLSKKGDPTHVFADESSRVRYLHLTRKHYIEGDNITIGQIVLGVFSWIVDSCRRKP